MFTNKKIFVIIGSASGNSVNQKIIDYLGKLVHKGFHFTVADNLKKLPHFNPELSLQNAPQLIIDLRKNIENADGVIICTPEYIFSIPSGLKNVIEWCIATTVFSNKPTGLITASTSGEKSHEELQLIMETAMAKFTSETTLLIRGVKGKITPQGQIIDKSTLDSLTKFANAFSTLVGKD